MVILKHDITNFFVSFVEKVRTIMTKSCEICKSLDHKKINITKKYSNTDHFYVCKNCGFVFVKNRRSDEEIQKAWSDEIFRGEFNYEQKIKNKPISYTAKIPAVISRLTYSLENLLNFVSTKSFSLCDIGAGEGDFLQMLRNKNKSFKPFFIEPSSKNCDLLKKLNFSGFNGTLESFKEKVEFDIITINWTLENTQSPRNFLRLCRNLIKENGLVSVATGSRILTHYKKPLDCYIIKNNPLDVCSYHFSKNSLCNILKVTGFDIVNVNRYFDTDYLCVIAKKSSVKEGLNLEFDDADKIIEFFNRWDNETKWFNKIN
jgi:2-polyprenyl-3-methyl-5-hydroxy-6-metoxy-1,4-benzoquinol methylase